MTAGENETSDTSVTTDGIDTDMSQRTPRNLNFEDQLKGLRPDDIEDEVA